jgi:predicted transcriptional regulator YdeE
MKTAESIHDDMYVKHTAKGQIELIREAQDEAWNEAIEAAAERAEVKDVLERIAPDSNHQIVDKQSILKLLK